MPSILIVEDHKEFREALRNFLEVNEVKANLLEASSGEEGVLLAKKKKPRVVIMDFQLGGLNGLEAAGQIKQADPQCHILMLTLFDSKEIPFIYRKGAVEAFINKSDLNEYLLPVLEQILN
ncbi:MAG: response regulator transcription factor [Candidatus Omnitrophota bacterium]